VLARKRVGLSGYLEVNECNKVVLNAAGGADWTYNPTSKVTSSRGINEDKLVVIPPVEGVLNGDVRHTQLYNTVARRHT